MKVSIILAVFNEEKYLKTCLESLLKQSNVADMEIIILDDGSKNKVKINQEKLNNVEIKIFRIKHSGPAIARNYAVGKATGKILVFLDGDMYFEPDFINELIAPIINGKAKGSYSSQEYVANWDNIWARCWNWENGLMTNLRINNKENMTKDFRAILSTEYARVKGFDDVGYTDTWTLSEKLGYLPFETKAKYYHYNPDTLAEVFQSARWIGGRFRKHGLLGKLISLIRSSIPISIILGILKSFKFRSLKYLGFKIVYDLGIYTGLAFNIKKK